jgi:hypothetical protein
MTSLLLEDYMSNITDHVGTHVGCGGDVSLATLGHTKAVILRCNECGQHTTNVGFQVELSDGLKNKVVENNLRERDKR